MSIAKEGYPYIFVLFGLTLIFFVLRHHWVGVVFLILALFVTYFFRDPHRSFAGNEKQIASPADGKVISVRREDGCEALSIFLSVFDVHVNRAPMTGTITDVNYQKGKFLVAYDERASTENERNSVTMERDGYSVRFVQIAGLVARRIVFWKKEGERVSAGDRVGLIKFGSRVDVFFPEGSKIAVRVGDRVRAGETVLGELP